MDHGFKKIAAESFALQAATSSRQSLSIKLSLSVRSCELRAS
jgi:hypothetical protein